MKVITFNYTKADNSTSERTLMVLSSPTKLFGGIDLSSLDPVDAIAFVEQYENMYKNYLEATKKLQAQFDIVHNYRQFKPENMSEVIEI